MMNEANKYNEQLLAKNAFLVGYLKASLETIALGCVSGVKVKNEKALRDWINDEISRGEQMASKHAGL